MAESRQESRTSDDAVKITRKKDIGSEKKRYRLRD